MNFKFSIIIPVYNGEKFIKDCIDSIERQNYCNYEIIMVNDGSYDNSKELLKKYEKSFKGNIKVINQENKGQIEARIAGINLACSDYCLFLDVDDTLKSNALEKINLVLNNYYTDMLIFNGYYMVNNDEVPVWPHYRDYIFYGEKENLIELKKEIISSRRFNNICFKAFKTDIIKKIDNYKKVSFVKAEEDLLMQMPFFNAIKNFVYLPENLYCYRFNDESVTHTFNQNKFDGSCYIFNELLKYGKLWNIENFQYYCQTRFCQDVISSIKQFSLLKKLNFSIFRQYLNYISNNQLFRKVIKSKKFSVSLKQRVILLMVYYECYAILFFFFKKFVIKNKNGDIL